MSIALRLLAVALLAWSTGGEAVNRYGKANNTWTTAATWSTNACGVAGGVAGVPALNDDVTICPGFTVTLNTSPPSMNSVTVQGTLSITGTARTLTVGGILTNSGTLQYASAATHAINVGGAFNNSGTFTCTAVGSTKTLTVGGLLTNTNVFNLAGNAALTVNANGGMTNNGTVTYTTGQAHQLNVTGAFTNNGTFTSANVGGARRITVSGSLDNTATGTFNLAGSAAFTVNANGGMTNDNNMTYTSGQAHQLNVTGGFTNTGTFTSAAVGGARALTVSGLITNSGTFRFHGTAAMTVNANGGITNSGVFDIDAASNFTHNLVIGGNVDNTGSFDLAPGLATDLANVTFNVNGTLTVSGNGATTRFNRITMNAVNNTINDMVDITAPNFTLAALGGNGVTYGDGTLRLSYIPPAPVTVVPFGAIAYTIPVNARFWLNSADVTVAHTGNPNITLNGGVLRIDAGTFDASATANNKTIVLQTNAATLLEVNGGALNVGGRIASNVVGAAGTFTMDGGIITVNTFGATATPFLLGSATTINQSGGTLVIERWGGAAADEYDVRSATANITGGTLQIGNGNTPAAQIFEINSVPPLWNLTLQNATGNAVLVADATLNGVLTLTSGHLDTDPPPAGGTVSTLTVGPNGSVSGGSAASHVIGLGNLVKVYNATGSFNFPWGDGTNYTPVTVEFTSLTTNGSSNVRQPVAGDHPDTTRSLSGVNPARSVNRYYTLANPTLTGVCNVTLNYLAGDNDGGSTPASFVIARGLGGCTGAGATRVCSSWTRPPLGGTPSATQASATGVPVIATDPEVDFVVGEPGLARFSRERQFIYGRETY